MIAGMTSILREDVVRLFRSLSNPTRFRILSLLRHGELCVDDIALILGIHQPRASFHLAHLQRSGLVEPRGRRRQNLYRLAPASSEFHGKLLECLAVFEHLPEVVQDARKARELRRSKDDPGPTTETLP